MVYFRTPGGLKSSELDERCRKSGLLLGPASETRIRMVAHVGLDADSVRQAVRIIKEAAGL
jgi:hypothetical protein